MSSFDFSRFPPEILNQILGTYSTSWLVIPLWLCGDRALQRKLAFGLTYVDLHAYDGGASFPFPRLLLQLRALRHLSVECSTFKLSNPTEWLDIIPSLPKSLETLIINADGSCPFLNVSRDPGAPGCITSQYERGSSHWIDLNALFPRLTRLGARTIDANDLAGLPPSLTSYAGPLWLNYVNSTHNFASCLPQALKLIEGVVKVNCLPGASTALYDDWLHAPLLERAKVASYDLVHCQRALPPALLRCKLVNHELRDVDLQAEPESLYMYRVIHERSYIPNYVAKFPRTLTHLTFDAMGDTLHGFSIAELPRTLNKFTMWIEIAGLRQQWESEMQKSKPDFWPPMLEVFIYHSNVNSYDLVAFPQTLRRLEVYMHQEVAIVASRFPPLLTQLTLELSHEGVLQGLFPPHITNLMIKAINSKSLTLEREVFERFPTPLRSLTLGTSFPDQRDLGATPPAIPFALTKLELNRWRVDWFGALPRTLLDLRISDLQGTLLSETLQSGALFEGLPASLVSLALFLRPIDDDGVANEELRLLHACPSQRLASLLPRLRTLSLDGMPNFDPSFIREFPQSLREVVAPLTGLNAEDASFLPQYLLDCDFGYSGTCDDEILTRYWPPLANGPRYVDLQAFADTRQARIPELCNRYKSSQPRSGTQI